MSWFSDVFDWVGSVFDNTAGYVVDTGGPGASGAIGESFGLGGLFGTAVDSVSNLSWGQVGKAAIGAAKSAFGDASGTGGTTSRSSQMSYKADYPTAQSQKATDAGTPRGLRSVDPETLAKEWYSRMNTLSNKFQ